MATRIAPFAASFAILAALVLAPTAGWSQTVGAAAAVKPSSTGTQPGGAAKTLQIGNDIVSNERIQTTETGSLQVMFVDKSSMTVGPNSNLIIDQFVYSANAGTGTFTANLTTGALRFVGGAISHTAGATINTPTATIGIRGGAAFINLDADCKAQKGNQSGPGNKCTDVVCTGGTCTVKSLISLQDFQLHIGQAVELGQIGVTFDVTSVNVNDVVKGGNGGVTGNPGNTNTQSTIGVQDSVTQTVQQAPEPVPPTPPAPGG